MFSSFCTSCFNILGPCPLWRDSPSQGLPIPREGQGQASRRGFYMQINHASSHLLCLLSHPGSMFPCLHHPWDTLGHLRASQHYYPNYTVLREILLLVFPDPSASCLTLGLPLWSPVCLLLGAVSIANYLFFLFK